MRWVHVVVLAAVAVALVTAGAAPAKLSARKAPTISASPAFTAQDLLALPNGNWISTGGNLFNERYSPLNQINTSTAANLKQAWVTHLDGSGSAAKYSAEGTPLVYNGIMYIVTGNDDVFALDATTGNHLWTYLSHTDQTNSTVCCGWDARGVAMGAGKIYVAQLDGSLVALDQLTGGVVWRSVNARWQEGYTMTMSPTYYNGLVYVGVSGAEFGARASETAYDANTGNRVWRFYAVPQPGDIGAGTWPANNEWETGGRRSGTTRRSTRRPTRSCSRPATPTRGAAVAPATTCSRRRSSHSTRRRARTSGTSRSCITTSGTTTARRRP